ncbi:MAG: RNA-binding domain-containing protein [Cyanobacteria bacterium J06627_28]
MTDAIFNTDLIREDVEHEYKRATGRDGKGALPGSLWETYSAFANTHGGVIVLGVEEKEDGELEAIGFSEPSKVLDDFWSQANNPQKLSRNILSDDDVTEYLLENGRWVIGIDIPRASRQDRPIFINGNPLTGTYRRQYAGDFRCPESEVRRMLAEQTEDSRDERILVGYKLDDIYTDSLKAYRNRLAALKPDHPYNGLDDLNFLQRLGGYRSDRKTKEEGLTVAGLLMFGRQEAIQEALSNYFVDYRELPIDETKTQWSDRLVPDGTWSGNLFDFYRNTIQRLFLNLKVPFRLVGDERIDDTPMHKALREALVNTMVHADYSARVPILVIRAPSYFEFRNPGWMRVPIHIAFRGGISDCRNHNIQRMFGLLNLGEKAGSGIPRVIENWRTQHYRFPELWEAEEPEATFLRLRTVSLLPEETLTDLRQRFKNRFDQLKEHERLALATAQIEGAVSNTRLQQICSLHPRDITTLLRSLVAAEFLTSTGKGRATQYQLVEVEVDADSDTAQLNLSLSDTEMSGTSSLSNDMSSLPNGTSSLSNDMSSLPNDVTSSNENAVASRDELVRIAEPVRGNRRVAPETTKAVILDLCAGRFLTTQHIAQLLNRSAERLRHRFIKPLCDAGQLERRFPDRPNHEQQAYRTKDS